MVGGRIDRGQLIEPNFETVRNSGAQFAIVGGRIQTFEKHKILRVSGSGLGEGSEFFNNNMRVTLDLALSVELLGGSEIIGISIDEKTSLHVLDGHLNSESLVRLERAKVLWGGKLGRGHVIR